MFGKKEQCRELEQSVINHRIIPSDEFPADLSDFYVPFSLALPGDRVRVIGNGSRNFEPRSNDVDELALPDLASLEWALYQTYSPPWEYFL
ncbi:hypothetical protein TNCV_163591 [Trichonephila clavipes]|nr:hypothetical protein TNCV_163591 [Trichonephila clavipes]